MLSTRFSFLAAALIAGFTVVGTPHTADAVPISGTVGIGGGVANPGDLSGVNFNPNTGGVIVSGTGDLASLTAFTTPVTLTDIDFSSLGTVWSAGGFSFSLTSVIGAVTTNGSGGIDFLAKGILTAAGFDPTSGLFSFSSDSNSVTSSAQFSAGTAAVPIPASILLFGSGIIGLGVLTYRRKSKGSTGSISVA